jgi:hypothetical protein
MFDFAFWVVKQRSFEGGCQLYGGKCGLNNSRENHRNQIENPRYG